MITQHKIVSHDVDGELFGVIALAQGSKGKSQKIFHILKCINITDPEWYMGKYVTLEGSAKDPKGLTSVSKIDIGNFKNQKEDPMKVFEEFPEYFL